MIEHEPSATEKHNSYSWIKPDADACEICGKKAFATPVDGFEVRECTNCSRPVCQECVDVDCDSDGEGYFVTSWVCKGEARVDCERIETENANDTESKAAIEDSLRRKNERVQEYSENLCDTLADELEASDRAHGIPPRDYAILRSQKDAQ